MRVGDLRTKPRFGESGVNSRARDVGYSGDLSGGGTLVVFDRDEDPIKQLRERVAGRRGWRTEWGAEI